jgi:1,4-alpha-glucan branching enzyme
MEMRRLKYVISLLLYITISIVVNEGNLFAQTAGKCDFKNNEFYVEVSKKSSPAALEDFIKKFDLAELDLKNVLASNKLDTLGKLGWKVVENNAQKLVITKPLFGSSDLQNLERNYINALSPHFAVMFPVVSADVAFGYNRFKNKHPFQHANGTTRFFLRNNSKAQKVMLAGSFNDWNPDKLAMQKTDSGWIADLTLKPGKYWYKFIIDGNWQVDNDNLLKENDGLGNTNSIFYVTNHLFELPGYANAKNVYLVGSFNQWKEKELKMQRSGNNWVLPLYMANGTHRYKFIVDGKWITDPASTNTLPNGHGSYNSVLAFGKPYKFNLDGYTTAGKVFLSGNFNEWMPEELPMKKTAQGWELDYVLAPGNYEYKFVVDGNWITDPANPLAVNNDQQSKNSFLVVQPNYTFKIKAFPNAKKVLISGDFNNWSPSGLEMQRVGDEWTFKIFLSPGKHKYKLIVDGEWVIDPTNELWEQNEYGTGNSVIWFEDKL